MLFEDSADSCASKCESESNCQVWTFISGASLCFLKESRSSSVRSPDIISGECTLTSQEGGEIARNVGSDEESLTDESTGNETGEADQGLDRETAQNSDPEEEDVADESGQGENARAEESRTDRMENTIQSCCPDSRRVLMIGESGVGKSTLGNRLLGNQNGRCSSLHDKKGDAVLKFGVGHTVKSETSSTSWITGNYLGIEGKCITIVDTPGVGDNLGRDCTHAMNTAAFVKNLNSIHAFVLVIKGTRTRVGQDLKTHIHRFLEMFGQGFWKKVLIEVTFWSHDQKSAYLRKKNRLVDEAKMAQKLNKVMADEFNLDDEIPVVFVDPVYKDLAWVKEHEREANKIQSDKLWSLINEGDPFVCGDFCTAPDSLAGIPTLVSADRRLLRAGSQVSVSWTIYFGRCDEPAIKSYSLYKNDTEVFQVDDRSNTKKPLDGFPREANLGDHCSTNEEESCSGGDSELKVIKLQFNSITEDDFGDYSIRNGKGSSRNATLHQITDGVQGEWSSFSPCTKTCLGMDGIWGKMERNRTCTEPQNGGLPCDGEQVEVRECAGSSPEAPPESCAGTPGEWQPWSPCSRSCGGGTQSRTRDCEGGTRCPKTETHQIESCNSQRCPVPSTYSDWSSWMCKETCIIPTQEKYETTEYRNRTCIDGDPKHSTINCDTMMQIYQEERGCSTVPECPPMYKVTATVCPQTDSGTLDKVKFMFQNCGVRDPECHNRKSCVTSVLRTADKFGHHFKAGKTIEFTQDDLGDCFRQKTFRSMSTLWVKALVTKNDILKYIPHDALSLCYIAVEFGVNGNVDFARWEWNGSETTTPLAGPGRKGKTTWLQLS